ncbi:hypothetical protein BGW41_004519 [Actinomortierella wolfii]|nr:hypothetical protein BGW41_004519 [Actinomortierella wolfii]
MEYAEVGSLARAISSHRLEWPDKKRIALQISRGLAYIHHERVIHRDLKSMNVLLTRHMEAKICDFGMATVKCIPVSESNNAIALKGTYRWMAPELFTEQPNYSTKSDMYSLGMVMWEMAANRTKPFSDQQDTNVVIKLVKEGKREVLPDNTPIEYRQWVERCWHQDLTIRPEAYDMIGEEWDQDENGGPSGDETVFSSLPTLSLSFIDSNVESTTTTQPSIYLQSQEQQMSPSQSSLGQLISRAKDGDVEAQVTLAEKYYHGDGVDQSNTRAVEWYLRAADQGNTLAQIRIGNMLSRGRGMPKNDVEAVSWFRKAAERGDTDGQVHLGVVYRDGKGVERNYIEAVRGSSRQRNLEMRKDKPT